MMLAGTVIFVTLIAGGVGFCDPMDDLAERFEREYQELVPPPNSSVDADYKIAQISLGTAYSAKSLQLIYRQNKELAAKYDSIQKKYDTLIQQNKEIIRLLSIIARNSNEPDEPAEPGNGQGG